jgi:hypothetical protein
MLSLSSSRTRLITFLPILRGSVVDWTFYATEFCLNFYSITLKAGRNVLQSFLLFRLLQKFDALLFLILTSK